MKKEDYIKSLESIKRIAPVLPKAKDILLGERRGHRHILFNFSCYLTIASFYLLAGIVVVQMIIRSSGNYFFEVLDSRTFDILAVSVFGQILGVIYIIAKSLWDGKEFDMLVKPTNEESSIID